MKGLAALAPLFEGLKPFTDSFKKLWNSKDRFAVRFVIITMGITAFILFSASIYMLRSLAPPADEEMAHQEHGEGIDLMGLPKIYPKEILEARDGIPEPGHDLVDPDPNKDRGVASLLSEDLKVELPYRFVEVTDIMTSTRLEKTGEGILMADIVLEVSTKTAQNEVERRKTEIRSMISSLIAERSKERLTNFKGMAALKTDIQREVNHRLRDGQVTDVLFKNYFVK
jgi:flagellar basal body-associated protein FliL